MANITLAVHLDLSSPRSSPLTLPSMNRIDTAQAPYELSKALREFTGKKVSGLTLGKPYEIKGGGMGRSITARLDGELKSFVAVEQQGKVGIYDAMFSPHADKVHEILRKSDEAFKKRSTPSNAAPSKGQSVTNQSTAAAGLTWPERQTKAASITTAARARRR